MFQFEFIEDLSEDNLVAVVVTTPDGRALELMSEVDLTGRTLVLRQFAIWGVGVGPGELGWPALRRLVRAVMETFDVDAIRIEEALRTSGANPGRTAKVIEFKR